MFEVIVDSIKSLVEKVLDQVFSIENKVGEEGEEIEDENRLINGCL